MLELEPFVPQEVCLSCLGCCRYAARDTAWQPLFLFEEILELTEKNIVPTCLFTHPGVQKKGAARIDLVACGDGFICPCFEPEKNKCKIYPSRPLDCRLYPFLLAGKDREACLAGRQAYLAIDIKCPYAAKMNKTKEMAAHARYLKEFLASERFLGLVASNPEIVQAYASCDIAFVAPLPALTRVLHGTSSSHARR